MSWLKSHWRWSALNLFAVFVLIYVLSQGSTEWSDLDTFDPELESGKWAVRFLLTSLTMTPLNTYLGWKSAIKLRKSAGLWAFGFAGTHVWLYIREAKWEWLTLPMPSFLALGLVGMTILSALAVTSNRAAMQRLGRNWKRLHRLVYVSGIAVVTHAMLATTMSKKLLFRDPQAQSELKIYMAVLAVLLVVRIPLARKSLKQSQALLLRFRKRVLHVHPALRADQETELWPRIHGRESSVSLKPTFIISTSRKVNKCPKNPRKQGYGRTPVPLFSGLYMLFRDLLIIPNQMPDRSETGGSYPGIDYSANSAESRAEETPPEEEAVVR